ncbi:MAG: hypothetical protein K2P14_02055, partial [Anaeroplasmataceae bacterium]|nr:hypothetical protein [Anaeroplasmataceae bacterium]
DRQYGISTIFNAVSLATIEKNMNTESGEFARYGMIIGSVNKSTKKAPEPDIASILTYIEGKIIGSHQSSTFWIKEEDMHTILQIGTNNMDSGKQTLVSIEDLTEEYLLEHSSFFDVPDGETEALWKLTEDHYLVLK